MYIWIIVIIVIILGLIAFYFIKNKTRNSAPESNNAESIYLNEEFLDSHINQMNTKNNSTSITPHKLQQTILPENMSLDNVELKYGSNARKVVNCVRHWPEGGEQLNACIVSDRDWWCKVEGLQWEESCVNCGVNLNECYSMSLLYDKLRKDGLIPNYF
uniref:Uncharacterized protein n=1 Tax=viral metagenome TaxID=1070528 RepID=A0A6C0JEA7_9ZZZZ